MNKTKLIIGFFFFIIVLPISLFAQLEREYSFIQKVDTLSTGEIQISKSFLFNCDTCLKKELLYDSEKDTMIFVQTKRETILMTEEILFWANSKIMKEHNVIYHNTGLKTHKTYHKNAKIHVSGSYLVFDPPKREVQGTNGIYSSKYISEIKDGIWHIYDENGNILKMEFFDKGIPCFVK